MTAHDTRCWICGSRDAVVWKRRSLDRPLVPDDFRITDDHYGTTLELLRCRDCGFLFASPEDMAELTSLYERLVDPEYEAGQEIRSLQMKFLLRKFRTFYPAAKTLLDIGAGAGALVAEAQKIGLRATGIEPSRSLVAAALRVNGVELVQGLFPHAAMAGQRFDVVCIVDVIEHVADPVKLLRDAAAALSPGGIVAVVTPDIASLPARMLGRRWWHLRLAHVGYFNATTLRQAAEAAGLSAVEMFRPVWYFPVRYLAHRLERFLPIAGLNRVVAGSPLGRLYDAVVPLDLKDSLVWIFRGTDDSPV